MKKVKRAKKSRHPGLIDPAGLLSKLKKKTDWAGVGPADAFRPDLDYYLRIPAQRMAYKLFRRIQNQAAYLAGESPKREYSPMVKPQLAPCYSTYPSSLSIHAAIGMTGFLEFQQRTSTGSLETLMTDYLDDPAENDQLEVHKESYKKMAHFICEKIQSRLLLEDLSRNKAMRNVEFYRLFTASQHNLQFRSVQDILDVAILFGDIAPDWQELDLHPLTFALLEKVELTCTPFLDLLPTTKRNELTKLGSDWVRALCRAISPYLPGPEGALDESRASNPRVPFADGDSLDIGRFDRKLDKGCEINQSEKTIAPLEQAQEPVLFEPQSPIKNIINQIGDSGDNDTDQTINNLDNILSQASTQQNQWEDMRSDLLEDALRESIFSTGPIEGNPADGHEVQVNLGGNLSGSGEIHDRPLEISNDQQGYEHLMEQASPITQSLKRILYPNVEQVPETVQLCTNGAIDPSRLSLSPMTDTIFKRNPVKEVSDKRGKPVLLIACDGSGSLSRNEMGMAKVLACSWLNATAGSEIELLAGIYHSGHIRKGVSGPLVQWMFHPRKTPTTSRREAARSIISLPESGTGVQSDALSISFMLNEAKTLARGRMVYLILISDCAWNRSFHQGLSGLEEVQASLLEFNDKTNNKLDTTLVALGVKVITDLENYADRIIHVSDDELTDYSRVAESIGTHVASIIRSQKHILKSS